MDRRNFLASSAKFLVAGMLGSRLGGLPLMADEAFASRFQYQILDLGTDWKSRQRALIRLSHEVQKRCNIPVDLEYGIVHLKDVPQVSSPFFVVSGGKAFKPPTREEARLLRLVLKSGGSLLFDSYAPKGDTGFYDSVLETMRVVALDRPEPEIIPSDHSLYQSYYLLKEPRGRLDGQAYLEGWTMDGRTAVFLSHNDLLGALDADRLGNWTFNMEIGGGFRRELCFRLMINMTYYCLTLNYKKDRAFPPVIRRRRRQ